MRTSTSGGTIPVEYAWIDDSLAALRRGLPARRCAPGDARRGIDALRRRAGAADGRGDTLAAALARDHPFIAGVVGWVDLQSARMSKPQLDALRRDPKLVGIRHIVQAEPDDFLLGRAFSRGDGALERCGLAYDILVYARQLPAAIAVRRRVSATSASCSIISGKPDIRRAAFDVWRRDLDRLAALPERVAKLSGLVTEADWQRWTPGDLRPYLDAALDSFGADRLMIGSDWPVCTVAGRRIGR